jgi:hypothetical protein
VKRLLVFDRTETGALATSWSVGAKLYRGVGRIDDTRGVASWDEALDWLASQQDPISQIQYWGHGKWGSARVDDDVLDASALQSPRKAKLEAIRERLTPDALVWFRTCETFGARAGIDFAERLADFLGCRVAGHTYVIAFHQSGLHGLAPGMRADWSPEEGLEEGTGDAPVRAKWSKPWAPRTITCLANRVPDEWFTMAHAPDRSAALDHRVR